MNTKSITDCRLQIADLGKRPRSVMSVASCPIRNPKSKIRNRLGFTLLELLLVVSIIGLLATVALPHLAGFGKSNSMTAATRQLLDDVALARQKAMSTRSTVYIVFVPQLPALTLATNLVHAQYSSYALYSKRSVGDQPGRSYARYLSDWKTLPQGVYIATNKFGTPMTVHDDYQVAWKPSGDLKIHAFEWTDPDVCFPNINQSNRISLPYIAFNSQGQLTSKDDEIIPLTRGSVLYMPGASLSVVETPAGNSTNFYNLIHIDKITGRAKLVRQEIQ